ncbi:hypothetical protein [Nocardia jinanensis]|uniref:Uncharacterized protein n=1 Tax=Nocardia jinanensis TaxID=382504 RepID=A0A917RXB9_9NOCA|nr:hypothetical protein [Nocardia jinanensis]GGL42791.1 hypothetical protein GCM10011588_66890 [Nocardia jinanensis]
MSEGETPEVPRRAHRRAGDPARLDRVFGEVLPSTTRDERDDGSESGTDGDDWLRSQVPPHHGGAG